MALVVTLLWAIGATLLALRLDIDNSAEVHFSANHPSIEFDHALRERFPQDQVLIALFYNEDIYSANALRSLHEAARTIEAHPLVARVLGPTTLERIGSDGETFLVGPLIDMQALDHTDGQAARDRVLGDRFAPGLVASPNGSSVALVIRPVALAGSFQRRQLERHVRSAIRDAGLESSLIALTGTIALDVAQLRSVIRDCWVFVPSAAGIGLLVVWWLFRRRLAVVLALLATWTTVASTFALVAAWGRPFTLAAAMIPALEAALTIALLIHVYTALAQASRRGHTGAMRVSRALEQIRRPALYTTLTTSAGLLSLSLSPVQSIQTFGVAAGIGAALVYPVVMGLFPAMLRVWDRRPWPVPRARARFVDGVVKGLARLAIRHSLAVVVVGFGALAVAAPNIAKVETETDLFEFFSDTHPLSISTRLVEEQISGVGRLDLVLDGHSRDDLKDPVRLSAIRELQTWLETLPEVDSTMSFVEIVEEMQWAFFGERPAYRSVPESRAAISQYLLIYDGVDLHELVDRDFRRGLVKMRLNVHGANEIQSLIARIEAHLATHPVADLEPRLTGTALLFAELEELLIQGQKRSVVMALGLMFVLMAAMWRSIPAALLCMIPNASPVLLIYILMGIGGIPLDLATVMIASVAVGVAVDDTIHLYDGYSYRRARGQPVVSALVRSYSQAGRAITATTIVLCAQFLVMASSDFVPTVEFGALTAVGLLAALGFDLLLLPALIVAASSRRSR